jgi:hypothetical protein
VPTSDDEHPALANRRVLGRIDGPLDDPLDYVDPTGQGFWSTLGKVLAGIVVVLAVAIAVVVVVKLVIAAAGLMLLGAAIGAIIGGIADGWQGAALGAMMGATIGINFAVGGPLGVITFLGVFPGIREQGWYHSLAGWTSWVMPASWPGHIMGLGIFLGNGIAHVFGSDKRIESTSGHDDRLFEKVAQSNVPEGDRGPGDQVIPIWT